MDVQLIQLSKQNLKEIVKSAISETLKEEISRIEDSNKSNKYLDTFQAAKYICFSIHTLRKQAAKGNIKAYKRKTKWIFLQSDLDDFIAQGRVFSKAEVDQHSKTILSKILT